MIVNYKENETSLYLDSSQHALNESSAQFSTSSSITPRMSYAAAKALSTMNSALDAQQNNAAWMQQWAQEMASADAAKQRARQGGRIGISETEKTSAQYFDPN